MPAVRRYLAETAKALVPGGRFVFTAFGLEPGREASEKFPFRPHDETSSTVDPQAPLGAIGHRREVLEAAIREAGFKSFDFHRGEPEYYSFQLPETALRPGRNRLEVLAVR